MMRISHKYIYIYPLPLELSSLHPRIVPLWVITQHQAELPVEQLPTSYCFAHGSVSTSVLLSQVRPPLFPRCVYKSTVYVCASIPAL